MTQTVVDPELAAAKVREAIDQHTDGGPYTPRLAAAEIVEKLRATEPDVLQVWLDSQAEHFVWQLINDRDRSRRGHAVRGRGAAAFKSADEAHRSGDTTALLPFLDAPYTVEDGSRRRLAELKHDDLVFVAETYDQRARDNALRAAFMSALAKKVKRGQVQDHFTEDKLHAMWNSLAA